MLEHPLIIVAIAYLIGSTPTAVIATRLLGLSDPRSQGSGNPGATNVLRTGGKLAALITLIGDIAKGVVPVLLGMHLELSNGWLSLVAIAAFFGHLFPIFLGFKGGKGVATAIGVFGALSLVLGAVYVLTWGLVAALFRYSSLASLVAAGVAGLASFAIFNEPEQLQLIGAVALIVAFLFQRHRENIERLRSGQEGKIGADR